MSVHLIGWHIIYFIAYIERGKRQASARYPATTIRLLRTRRSSPGRALSTWHGRRRRVDLSPRLQVELLRNGVSFPRVLVSRASVQIMSMWLGQTHHRIKIYPNLLYANFDTSGHASFRRYLLLLMDCGERRTWRLICKSSMRARVSVGFRPKTDHQKTISCTGVRLGRPTRVRATPRQFGAGSRKPGRGRRGGIILEICLRWAIDTRRYFDLNVYVQVCLRL